MANKKLPTHELSLVFDNYFEFWFRSLTNFLAILVLFVVFLFSLLSPLRYYSFNKIPHYKFYSILLVRTCFNFSYVHNFVFYVFFVIIFRLSVPSRIVFVNTKFLFIFPRF
uniref:Uncharacterized protein n=1 Tax=Cacopsylla melanoneura TaxID=428564 RepID=A0A8D8WE11_9HEMI